MKGIVKLNPIEKPEIEMYVIYDNSVQVIKNIVYLDYPRIIIGGYKHYFETKDLQQIVIEYEDKDMLELKDDTHPPITKKIY